MSDELTKELTPEEKKKAADAERVKLKAELDAARKKAADDLAAKTAAAHAQKAADAEAAKAKLAAENAAAEKLKAESKAAAKAEAEKAAQALRDAAKAKADAARKKENENLTPEQIKIKDSRKALLHHLEDGQAFFESPEGYIVIGETGKDHVWCRAANNGKGMKINKMR